MTERNKTIEIMKAFFIIGVVILHAVFIHDGENGLLTNTLRLVCVNGFFALSGYVIYGKVENTKWVMEKIIRRIPMLIIFTTIFWAFNHYVIGVDGGEVFAGGLLDYAGYNTLTGFVLSVLWYIWLLNIGYVILWAFEKVKVPRIPYIIQLLILMCFVFIPIDYCGFNLFKWYGLFMIGGYAYRYYEVEMVGGWKPITKWGVMLGLIPPLLLLIPKIRAGIIYSGEAVNGGYVHILNSFSNAEYSYIMQYIAYSLCGFIFIAMLSHVISKTKLSKAFVSIGGATIGILLLHKPFLELQLVTNPYLSPLIAVAVSLLLYWGIKKIKFLDFVLFGGTDIPIKISNKLEGWYGKAQS